MRIFLIVVALALLLSSGTILGQTCTSNVNTPWDASHIVSSPWAGALTPLGSALALRCPVDHSYWSVQLVSTGLGQRQMMCSPTDVGLSLIHSYGMFVQGIQAVSVGATSKYGSGTERYSGVVRNFIDSGINMITDYGSPNMLPRAVNPSGAVPAIPQIAFVRPDFYGQCATVTPNTSCGSNQLAAGIMTDSVKEIYRQFPQGFLSGGYTGGHEPDYGDPNLANYIKAYFGAGGTGAIYTSNSPWIPAVMAHDTDWTFGLSGAGDRWLSVSDGVEDSRYGASRNHTDASMTSFLAPPDIYATYVNNGSSIGPRPYISTSTPTVTAVAGTSLAAGTYTYQILLSQTAGQEVGQAVGYRTLSCTVNGTSTKGCQLNWTLPTHQQIDNPDGFWLVRNTSNGHRITIAAVCTGSACTFTDDGTVTFTSFANGFTGPFTLASASQGFGLVQYKTTTVFEKQIISNVLQNGDPANPSFIPYGTGNAGLVALNNAWLLPNRGSCTTGTIHSCDIDSWTTDRTTHRAVNLGALANGTQTFNTITLDAGGNIDPRSVVLYYTTDSNPANDAAECLMQSNISYSSSSPCKAFAVDDGNGNNMSFAAVGNPEQFGCLVGDPIGAYDGLAGNGTSPTANKYGLAAGGGNCSGGWLDYKNGIISKLLFIFPVTSGSGTNGRLVADYNTGGYGSGKGIYDVRGTSAYSTTALWGGIFPLEQRGWPCHMPNDTSSTDGMCTITPTTFTNDTNALGFSIVRTMALNERLAINATFPKADNTVYFGTTYEGGAGVPTRGFVMAAFGSSYTDPTSHVTHAHIADVLTEGQIPLVNAITAQDQAKIDWIYANSRANNTVDTSGLPLMIWVLSNPFKNVDSVYAPNSSQGNSSFADTVNAATRGTQQLAYVTGILGTKNTANGVLPVLGYHYWDQNDHTNASYGIFSGLGFQSWHGKDPGGIVNNIVGTPTSVDYLNCPIGGEAPTLSGSISPGSSVSITLTPALGFPAAAGDNYSIEDNLSGTNLETVHVASVTNNTTFVATSVAHAHPTGAYAWDTSPPSPASYPYGDFSSSFITSNGLWLGSGSLSIVTTSCPSPAFQNSVYVGCQIIATGGTAPYTFTINSGTLCTGLSLSSGGLISGTPTVIQTCSFTVKVTDNVGAIAVSVFLVIQVQSPMLIITTTSCPSGILSVAYSCPAGGAPMGYIGGNGTNTWSISGGTLPTGLNINSGTGSISGTPTGTGTFPITVKVVDSESPPQQATQPLLIVIVAPNVASTGLQGIISTGKIIH